MPVKGIVSIEKQENSAEVPHGGFPPSHCDIVPDKTPPHGLTGFGHKLTIADQIAKDIEASK